MTTSLQLPTSSIPERWNIQNVFLAHINEQSVDFKIIGAKIGTFSEAILYHHGFAGSIDDCPEIDEFASAIKPLIRVSAYGAKPASTGFLLPLATFGDACALLYNSRQAILGIADTLQLSSYQIAGHSWGGFIALLAALADRRCQRCMMLGSTPDICDAVTRLGSLIPVGGDFIPEVAKLLTPGVSWDAQSAKFGKAVHQTAWDVINPYKPSNNHDLELLIFNREEDKVMLKEGVLHFQEYCKNVPIARTEVKFVADPARYHHDMPFSLFHEDMVRFFKLKPKK